MQNVDAAIGHYIISDCPMSEEQWIGERAVMDTKRLPKPTPSSDQAGKSYRLFGASSHGLKSNGGGGFDPRTEF